MRRRLFRKLPLLLALLLSIGLVGIWQLPRAFADGGSFGVSNPGTITNGNTFSVTVTINPTVTIDTVDTYISYDGTKLSLQSVSCTSAFFTTYLPSCLQSGNPLHLSATRLDQTSTTQSQTIATLTFKATAGGSAAISASGSVDYQGNYIGPNAKSPTTGSVSVTINNPSCPSGYTGTYPNCTAPTPPSGGGSSGGGSSGGSTTGGSSGSGSSGGTTKPPAGSTGSTTPPPTTTTTSTAVQDQKVEFTNAALTITTTAPAQVYIEYGTTADALTNSTSPDALGTTHTVALDPKLLIPGETYYYTVVTKDAQGNITQTKVESFTTKGLTISVGVFDKNHQPLKHKQVTLHSNPATATTDDKGYAVFSNVIPGDHHVSYSDGKQSYQQAVAVLNNVTTKDGVQVAPTQNFSVVYGITQSSNSVAVPASVAAVLVLAAGVGVFLFLRNKKPGQPLLRSASAVVTAPVVSDSTPAPTMPVQDPVEAQPTADPLSQAAAPPSPQPGSMIAPKDDAEADNVPREEQ